jgi:Tn3 transposase DDE domain
LGTTSSSDGQYFCAGGRGEALADINAPRQRAGRRFLYAHLRSVYTHISDQFGPFYTKVIAATATEAPHVLDGLLYHQTGLQIEEHYTDTGGVTDHVFGLCPVRVPLRPAHPRPEGPAAVRVPGRGAAGPASADHRWHHKRRAHQGALG